MFEPDRLLPTWEPWAAHLTRSNLPNLSGRSGCATALGLTRQHKQLSKRSPAAGFLLCCVGSAASAASAALDPAAALAVSAALDPAAAAEVLGAAATEQPAARPCRGAALMLSMRVSTIVTAVCKSRQQGLGESRQ